MWGFIYCLFLQVSLIKGESLTSSNKQTEITTSPQTPSITENVKMLQHDFTVCWMNPTKFQPHSCNLSVFNGNTSTCFHLPETVSNNLCNITKCQGITKGSCITIPFLRQRGAVFLHACTPEDMTETIKTNVATPKPRTLEPTTPLKPTTPSRTTPTKPSSKPSTEPPSTTGPLVHPCPCHEEIENLTVALKSPQDAKNLEHLLKIYNTCGNKLDVCGLCYLGSLDQRLLLELIQRTDFPGNKQTVITMDQFLQVNKVNNSDLKDMQLNVHHKNIKGSITIELPQEALEKAVQQNNHPKAAFSVLINNTQFNENQLLQGLIIVIDLGNASISNLQNPLNITFRPQEVLQDNGTCSFWNSGKNGSGIWDNSGLQTDTVNEQIVCKSTHLTFFAVLLQNKVPSLNEEALDALKYISYVGCGISAVFSAITILSFFKLKKVNIDNSIVIHVNLSASLLLLYFFFLVNDKLSSLRNMTLCKTIAVCMHYSLLSSFNWMGVEAFHMYLMIIKVYNTYVRRYLLKLSLVGWGVPVLVIIIFASVDQYDKQDIITTGNKTYGEFCWLKANDVYLVNLSYFAVTFLFSAVVLALICWRMYSLRRLLSGVPGRCLGCRDIFNILGLTCLLGTSWGFTFWGYGPMSLPVFIVFSVLNSLQGLFVFLLVLLNLLREKREHKMFLTRSTNIELQPRATQQYKLNRESSGGTFLDCDIF
ncbi:adhesion G-protein coupled receptor G5-like isoform X1 [Acipenser oxyrinchus oxyrinchus]|uniref:Adhesion G-protein coupled receptor G5-like isoform X1 n=1 Tax=Acipenser oxyrinchus oxyrinchus TaxID=40147 RepID=A0AAD8D6Y8_ACIOX|nr:adhesion G-protein coupled receptor G5-like isoform X1 [Acipenser oxyrinchus oxyrinchus]